MDAAYSHFERPLLKLSLTRSKVLRPSRMHRINFSKGTPRNPESYHGISPVRGFITYETRKCSILSLRGTFPEDVASKIENIETVKDARDKLLQRYAKKPRIVSWDITSYRVYNLRNPKMQHTFTSRDLS